MTYPEVQKFLDRHVLQVMHECSSSFGMYETGWHLQCFVNDWITKDMVRAICRSLTDRGHCHYMRALWSDDGMLAVHQIAFLCDNLGLPFGDRAAAAALVQKRSPACAPDLRAELGMMRSAQ